MDIPEILRDGLLFVCGGLVREVHQLVGGRLGCGRLVFGVGQRLDTHGSVHL